MGRHSLPDDYATRPHRDSSPPRRRTVVVATMLVLAVAAGTAVAAQGGLLSFSKSCEEAAVRLSMMPTDAARAGQALVTSAGGKARPAGYATSSAIAPSAEDVQETLGMWTITVQGPRLTAVVDASGSMATIVPVRNRSRMDVTKASSIQALGRFTPNDEIGLWEFAATLDGAKDHRRLVPTVRLGDPVKGGGTHRVKLAAAFSRAPADAERCDGSVRHHAGCLQGGAVRPGEREVEQRARGSPDIEASHAGLRAVREADRPGVHGLAAVHQLAVAARRRRRAPRPVPSPASSARWYVSACQDAPFTRRLQRSSMTPR